MLEGHLGHHSFMLAPLIAWLLIRGRPELCAPSTWWPIALAALLLTYVVIAAGGPVMPQVLAAVVMLLAFAALLARLPLRSGLARLVLAGGLAALVLGPVLLATVAFMLNNPRSWFPLPQFATADDAVWHGLGIMLSPWRDTAALRESLVHTGTLFEWHELEYGLTLFPSILVPAGILALWARRVPVVSTRAEGGLRLAPLALLIALAVSPFVLNTYQGPEFIQTLRDLPVIGSTSNLFRWFVLPMLAIALVTAAAAHWLIRRSAHPDLTGLLLATACLATITFHYAVGIDEEMRNRSVTYDNTAVEAAYARFQDRPAHAIEAIGFHTDVFRNDSFLDGQSAQYCYEAALGYQLEGLEYTTVPGPVLELIEGRYNMNNPSCYVYPFENRCRRGDRFSKERIQDVVALTHYQNIDFEAPNLHRALAVLAPVGLVLMLGAILFPGVRRLALRARRPPRVEGPTRRHAGPTPSARYWITDHLMTACRRSLT